MKQEFAARVADSGGLFLRDGMADDHLFISFTYYLFTDKQF